MPIDESLLTCDDTELNQRLLDKGFKLLYTPDVFVLHYRRPSPKKLWNQMYRYAIGRLQVGKRDRRMINMIHISIGTGIPAILFLLLYSPLLLLFFSEMALLLLFLLTVYAFLKTGSFPVSVLIPLVVVIIFFAWSAGFMRELISPIRNVEGK
jgi:GT2 family glycosyltransferase